MSDRDVIEAQIGRSPRGRSIVVSRCALELPVVVAVPPVLEDGAPFPTHYWLTCPLAHRRIARLEAAGEVKAWEQRLAQDPALAAAMQAAHTDYMRARDAVLPASALRKPTGGIAGLDPRGGVKCLHAHYAHARAGGANPVGQGVAQAIEPLNCSKPCVADQGEGVARAADWREPAVDAAG